MTPAAGRGLAVQVFVDQDWSIRRSVSAAARFGSALTLLLLATSIQAGNAHSSGESEATAAVVGTAARRPTRGSSSVPELSPLGLGNAGSLDGSSLPGQTARRTLQWASGASRSSGTSLNSAAASAGAAAAAEAAEAQASLDGSGGGRRRLTRSKPKTIAKRAPARGGEYVSLGKVRAFEGDVKETQSLAQALQHRTYKRELILLTDTRPRAALQSFDNLAQLGLVHVLWLTSNQASCAAMRKLYAARNQVRAARGAWGNSTSAGATAGAGTASGSDPAGSASASDLILRVAAAADAATGGYSVSGVPPQLADDDLMGCAWYTQDFPAGFIGHRRLMMKRLMLTARTLTLGYSVLSLDTDVVVYRDPYPYFKSPPYDRMHAIVGKAYRQGGLVNTGVTYYQNASRTGPTAWMVAEVVDRNLRWLEHNVSMPHMSTGVSLGGGGGGSRGGGPTVMPHQADTRGCWDQFLFGDVVLSSMVGKLVMYYCARPLSLSSGRAQRQRAGRKKEEEDGWSGRHRAALGLGEEQTPTDLLMLETTEVQGDKAMEPLVGATFYETQWVNLTIAPDPPPLLPAEPGYSLPPLLPGGVAEAFKAVLAADAKFAEAAISSGGGGAEARVDGGVAPPPASRPMERLAYAADWLVGGWVYRGMQGYWDPILTNGKPKQVFGHLVRAPGPTSVGKDAVRMQYGEYDWELAAVQAGGPYPFLGSPDPKELPRVVALLPDLDLTVDTGPDWSNLARGLVTVALVTGRRVVWPSVPCSGSDLVQPKPGSRKALPLNANLRFFSYGPWQPSLRCVPSNLFHHKCLFERMSLLPDNTTTAAAATATATGTASAAPAASTAEAPESGDGEGESQYYITGPRGLLPAEFALLLKLLPEAEAAPGPHNTVHLQGNDDYESGGEKPIMFDEPPRVDNVAYVPAPSVVKSLREGALAQQRVIYLAQRTFLTKLDKLNEPDLVSKYRAFKHECPALK
ncbi:hypothetical protein HYH03_000762 [Edaphochlamys debaryana]|uniref:Nucleotide-diphospho-sugar transferase domain-containing protein n=1 Tax=Edaphochlamys debaryana TaxID=47281 RepID=A0A836C6P5_9CHLO|nr:hypothetical protein HYH03_000762 [Edaphochlamys debaryana]|eukprot:KAG2500937.1 hypothetical protein HYH03_000762 [Edaphochlamys debaryana]